jgi:hypothetical protein
MRPHRGTRAAATRAWDGMLARPASPHAEGPVRARTRIEPVPRAGLPLLPPHREPPHRSWRGGRRAASAAGWSEPGQFGAFVPTFVAPGFKGRARPRPERPSHHPHRGFPFFTSEHTERGREQTRHRCVEPREGAAAPGRRRRAKDDDYNRHHEERRGGRPRWEKKPDRSGDIHAVVNAYTAANTFATPPSILEPATTTPSHRREHHRGPLPLSFPLDYFFVWHRRRWGVPSGVLAWLPAFEPQYCRTANKWRSRAIHAPGPAVAVRGPSEIAGLRAEHVVQGTSCAAASPRVTPLATRRLRRASKARPSVLYTRLWPAHAPRAPC